MPGTYNPVTGKGKGRTQFSAVVIPPGMTHRIEMTFSLDITNNRTNDIMVDHFDWEFKSQSAPYTRVKDKPVKKNLLRRALLGVIAVFAIGAFAPPAAEGHYYSGCKKFECKTHVAKPYRTSFLGPVGACESGTHSYSLKAGLRAYNPAGPYLGRYQFGWPDWLKAGGHSDPRYAPWWEQAYRAVVWLHKNGRDSWPNC